MKKSKSCCLVRYAWQDQLLFQLQMTSESCCQIGRQYTKRTKQSNGYRSSFFQVPVYFTLQNNATKQLVQDLKQKIESGMPPSAVVGGYKAIVKSKTPSPIKTQGGFFNILGWLQAAEMVGSGDVFRGTPTIAVVANYDSFSTAPGLAYGADSNASGVVILLQLMKMFSKLYSRQETRPTNYNLLFLLTSGGHWNYAGTEYWLNSRADPSLLETVELAICLDSLGKWTVNKGQVSMYYSKPGKDESVQKIYDTFKSAAEEMEIPFAQVHKKINISSETVAHQHEHFNKKRVLGITLSGKSEQNSNEPTFFDRKSTVDIDALQKVSQFVGEAITNLIYTEKRENLIIFSGDSSVDSDEHYMHQMLDMLTMTSRFAPQNLPLKEGLIPALKNVFDKYLKGVKIDQFIADKRVRLFDSQILELKIVSMAGVLFDVFLLFGIFLMLLALFAVVRVYLFGFEELRRDITVVFQPQVKKGGKKR
eukprot:TRINITY_DN17235_c0_g3_i3.p1 TRINITY_DN17235_c0_g3~~TRINITY_DN17235_c0_g3_i3.p1  ORF type:complete len:478 (-),score=75.32 TRINITY_DN17235_c0_g3_i3:93-1526(-)